MAVAFIAAQAIALVALLLTRYRYPWFLAALACWTAQAVNATVMPGGAAWPATWWLRGEALVIVATTAACIEAILRARSHVESPFLRHQLGTAVVAIPACLVGMGIIFVAPPAASDLLGCFRLVRCWAWMLLALSIGLTALLLALQGAALPALPKWHLWLMLLVMAAHALICWYVDAPDAVRAALRDAYRSAVITACGAWIYLGLKSRRI